MRPGLIVLCLVGCGEPDGDALDDADEPPPIDDRTDGEPRLDVIEIPMQPVTSATLTDVPTLEDGVLTFDASLTLARGEGYPRSFTATMSSAQWAPCGMFDAEFDFGAPEHFDDGSGTQISLNDDEFVVEVGEPGVTTLRSRGTATLTTEGCDTPAGTTVELEFGLTVYVRDAIDSTLEGPCGEQPWLLAPGASMSANDFTWIRASLRDEEGTFYANNAAQDAQVSLRLHGSFEAQHATPASFSSWIPPLVPGPIEVVPAFGDSAQIEVVGAEAITDVDVQFQIAGTAGGGFPIVDGESYGPGGYARSANRAIPGIGTITVGERPLCSAPSQSWFQLETRTPDVCEIVPHEGEYLFSGDTPGSAGRLLRDGTCTLELSTPAGTHRVSSTFSNVEALLDFG